MHEAAMEWIAKHADSRARSVLDIGGRDINGSPRDLFPLAVLRGEYIVLDARAAPGVDIVADAATWRPKSNRRVDVVVCAETFEHTASWRAIVRTAYKACKPGGVFIVTTAAPGRPPHSGADGEMRLLPGEHYANIRPAELERVLKASGWEGVTVDVQANPADVRAVAVKPGVSHGGR